MLLDTHAWIWWLADPERLGRGAARRLARADREGDPVYVSSISVWEVAMLVARGRLELTMDVTDWLGRAASARTVTFVPVDNAIALRAVQLPGFPHRDPADRMIVATAIGLDATLLTGDRALQDYRGVTTLWR